MSTKQQILARGRLLIDQTDSTKSNFTDDELVYFLDEGVRYIGALTGFPRDVIKAQAQQGYMGYTLPADFVTLLNVWFGDPTKNGDLRNLTVTSEDVLSGINPGWLEETTESEGTPSRCLIYDKDTLVINPAPDAVSSASGKKVLMQYAYSPRALTADGDMPDLPIGFHDMIPHYIKAMCYKSKLKDESRGEAILQAIEKRVKLIEPVVDKETKQMSFQWGGTESTSDIGLTDLIP